MCVPQPTGLASCMCPTTPTASATPLLRLQMQVCHLAACLASWTRQLRRPFSKASRGCARAHCWQKRNARPPFSSVGARACPSQMRLRWCHTLQRRRSAAQSSAWQRAGPDGFALAADWASASPLASCSRKFFLKMADKQGPGLGLPGGLLLLQGRPLGRRQASA